MRTNAEHEVEAHCLIDCAEDVFEAGILMTAKCEFAEEDEISLLFVHEEEVP